MKSRRLVGAHRFAAALTSIQTEQGEPKRHVQPVQSVAEATMARHGIIVEFFCETSAIERIVG